MPGGDGALDSIPFPLERKRAARDCGALFRPAHSALSLTAALAEQVQPLGAHDAVFPGA